MSNSSQLEEKNISESCSKVSPHRPAESKVNHSVGKDAEIEAKVREICGIMFETLRRNFPLHSDKDLIRVAGEIMNDINEG